MKKHTRYIAALMILASLFTFMAFTPSNAESHLLMNAALDNTIITSEDKSEDSRSLNGLTSDVVLTIPVGEGEGEISYLIDDSYVIGPTDYCIVDANKFYVLNSNKKEVIHAEGNQIIGVYDLAFCEDPVKLSVDENKLYILDQTSIVVISVQDESIELINMPNGICAYSVDIFKASHSCIYLQTYSGDAYEFVEGNCSVVDKRTDVSVHENHAHVRIENQEWSFEIANAFVNTIGTFNDELFVLVGEHSKIDGDMTCSNSIRKYSKDGALLASYQYDESDLVCMIPAYFKTGNNGKLYILQCYQDKISISMVDLIENKITRTAQNNEVSNTTEETPSNNKSTPPAVSLSRNAVKARADSMRNQTWYLEESSTWVINDTWLPDYIKTVVNNNPNYPVQMSGTGIYKKGIPYCWGGFNGYDSTGTSLPYLKFSDAITEYIWGSRYPMAGNVKSPNDGAASGYKGGTVGLDCSGFVSSAFGYTQKRSASDFYNDTVNFVNVSNYSDIVPMDIFVCSSHIMLVYAVENASTGVFTVVDATKTTRGRVCKREGVYYTNLSGYKMRRPKTWNNCAHTNHGLTYYSDLVYHWNQCTFCNAYCNYQLHQWVYIGANGYRCSVCGKTSQVIISPRSARFYAEKTGCDEQIILGLK